MKVEMKHDVVTNIDNSVKFSLSNNAAKLFSALGNFLYSNKELAVVHEISANCIDAHKLSGIESTPFKVSLPTTLDAYIRFRDYGPGLSEGDVYRLLTTYGESTKNETNTFVGGWGIGSKSPASVTDTWEITSHHDGMKSYYIVFIGEDSVPKITKLFASPTAETGIEVAIPVQSNRTQIWKNAVVNAYRHYPVIPDIEGLGYALTFKNDRSYNAGDWWISSENAAFITSNRAYSIDVNKIKSEISNLKVSMVLDLKIKVMFDIGELELSLSRESIQYTKSTMRSIEARLEKIYDHLEARFETYVDGSKDFLDHANGIWNFIKETGGSEYVLQHVVAKFNNDRFSIKSIPNDIQRVKHVISGADYVAGKFAFFYQGRKLNSSSRGVHGLVITPNSRWCATAQKYLVDDHSMHINISGLPNVEFYVNDANNYLVRGKHVSAENPGKVFVVAAYDKYPDYIKCRIKKTSDINIPKVVREKKEKVEIESFAYVLARSMGRFEKVEKSSLATKKVCYTVVDSYTSYKYDTIDIFLTDVGVTIVGVKSEKDIPTGGLVVHDFLEEYVKQELNSKEYKAHIENIAWTNFASVNVRTMRQLASYKTPKTSLWNDLTSKYSVDNGYNAYSTTYLYNVIQFAKLKVTIPTFDDAKADGEKLFAKYPLLRYIQSNVPLEEVKVYINLVG